VQQFAVEVVNNVEGSKSFPRIKRVAHEVGRPRQIGLGRDRQRLLSALRQSLLCPALQVQPQLAVDAIYPLVVPAMLATQYLEALPESPARVFVD